MVTQEKKQTILKNRYQLGKKIRVETTGEIYSGWDIQTKKEIQIKRIFPQLLSLALVEKIQESLYRLATIKHDSLLIPFDCSLEKKNFFLIQEPIKEDETIADILNKIKSFTRESAIFTVKQVAQALAYLHQKKICHGNLNPANISILKNGNILIKNCLIDAIIQHAQLKKDKLLAAPTCQAPEQLQGKPTKPQSDIWALGSLFYKLLTGDTPYKESSQQNEMLRNLAEQPVKPTLRNPKIPKYLEDLILKSIQSQGNSRQNSMLEFLTELESKKVPIKLKDLELKKKQNQSYTYQKRQNVSPVKRDYMVKKQAFEKQKNKKPIAKKPGFLTRLFSKKEMISTKQIQGKIRKVSQQVPSRIKSMADKFDQLIEAKKTQPPLFKKPKTFSQKLFLYGTLIIALGIIVALTQSLFIGYFTSIPEIKVPDLHNLPLEEAQDILENNGLKGKVVSELMNSSVPLDHIVSQKPEAGRIVKKDRIIKLFISKGVGEAKVPEIVGRAVDQATSILNRGGLGLEISKYVYNTNIQKNYIIKQNPERDVIVQKNTSVNAIVSNGYPTALKLKDKSKDNYVVEAMLFVPNDWKTQQIKVTLSDSRGTRTVFNQKVLTGQKRRIQLVSEDTALVEVFYNDELALKQSFQELESAIQ